MPSYCCSMSWISSWNTPATSTATAPGIDRAPHHGRRDRAAPRPAVLQWRRRRSGCTHAQRAVPGRSVSICEQVGRQRDEDRLQRHARCHRRRVSAASGTAGDGTGDQSPPADARAAMAPAPRPISSSTAWPRLSVSTTIQRWCSISSTPTTARCTATSAEQQADQHRAQRAGRCLVMPASSPCAHPAIPAGGRSAP